MMLMTVNLESQQFGDTPDRALSLFGQLYLWDTVDLSVTDGESSPSRDWSACLE